MYRVQSIYSQSIVHDPKANDTMANTRYSKGLEANILESIPKSFPEAASCRARLFSIGFFYECLSQWAGHCPFNVKHGPYTFCSHESSAEIAARTKDAGRS